MYVMIVCWVVLACEYAFGQEINVEKLAGELPALHKVLAIMVGVQVGLYGLAEALTRVSVWTENKWDNKAAHYVGQAAWAIGALLGKFGYSVPKLVLEEKAKQMNTGKSDGEG